MEVNQKQLAMVLGISARRVRQLREDGFFQFVENSKKYSLEKCVQEYIDYKVKAEMGPGTSINKEKEQAEHESIKKEISKLKLRKMRKEIHEAADVENFLNNMLLSFRSRLLAVPGKVAPQILGETDINVILQTLMGEMNETLDDLSEYDPDSVNGGNEPNYFDEENDYDDDQDYEDDVNE